MVWVVHCTVCIGLAKNVGLRYANPTYMVYRYLAADSNRAPVCPDQNQNPFQ